MESVKRVRDTLRTLFIITGRDSVGWNGHRSEWKHVMSQAEHEKNVLSEELPGIVINGRSFYNHPLLLSTRGKIEVWKNIFFYVLHTSQHSLADVWTVTRIIYVWIPVWKLLYSQSVKLKKIKKETGGAGCERIFCRWRIYGLCRRRVSSVCGRIRLQRLYGRRVTACSSGKSGKAFLYGSAGMCYNHHR